MEKNKTFILNLRELIKGVQDVGVYRVFRWEWVTIREGMQKMDSRMEGVKERYLDLIH